MTYYERVNELRDNTNFTPENYELEYLTTEVVLADLFGEYIKGAEVKSSTYGIGRVTEASGNTFADMFMTVAFLEAEKRFAILPVITGKILLTKFADISEIGDAWDEAYNLHVDITKKYTDLKETERKQQIEAAKKAEAEKKAEIKYQQLKEKALKDFENLTTKTREPVTEADEFYYALGWLANHVGSLTAVLPDYLGPTFERHFGAEAPKTLVDSRAKTIGGYAKQWSWEFKCTIKKLKETVVPACIQPVTTDFSKGIHNTSFLWDLVENYGFQFGKKQDVEKIKQNVPAQCLPYFEAGMIA